MGAPPALLDANVLIALVTTGHVHHQVSRNWVSRAESFSTCPVTQGALVRFLLRQGSTASLAATVVRQVQASPRHVFWADDVPYDAIDLRGVVGHRQATDAYLAGLARHRSGRLLTLDAALATLHADVAELLVS